MVIAALALLVLALGWEWFDARRTRPAAADNGPGAENEAQAVSVSPSPLEPSPKPPPRAPPPPLEPAGPFVGDARPHPVNLQRLRAELPDNLYWLEGAPTTDEEALRDRADRTRARKELAARIQANDATPEEIASYYAQRERLSSDFVAFAARVLELYGDTLPEQERGLYTLTVQLHRARLDELPKQREEALARYAEAERRRAQWRERGATP